MLTLSGDPTKKKKKSEGVDDCTDGACAPKQRAKMSLSKFNPTKKRYSFGTVEKIEEEKPKPTGNLHMNMNQLGANPGDVQAQKNNSKVGQTPEQVKASAESVKNTKKQKKALKLPTK